MATAVIIEATAQHTASLVFLHGLGDTGHGWAPVMRQMAKRLKFMKFICPHAYIPLLKETAKAIP